MIPVKLLQYLLLHKFHLVGILCGKFKCIEKNKQNPEEFSNLLFLIISLLALRRHYIMKYTCAKILNEVGAVLIYL